VSSLLIPGHFYKLVKNREKRGIFAGSGDKLGMDGFLKKKKIN
jgi:hypothetical protein